MKKSSKTKAFTLIEIMVVIIIIAVISAVILPNLMSSGDNIELTANTQTLKQNLDYCQSVAVRSNSPCYVLFDGNKYEIQSKDKILQRAEIAKKIELIFKKPEFIPRVLDETGTSIENTKDNAEDKDDEANIEDGRFAIGYYPNGSSDIAEINLKSKNKTDVVKIDFFGCVD